MSYNSDDDDGDILFDSYRGHDTVATLPLTQPLRMEPKAQGFRERSAETIQVEASSPQRPSPPRNSAPKWSSSAQPRGPTTGSTFASSFAPPGTTFRSPYLQSQAFSQSQSSSQRPPIVQVNFSDDEAPTRSYPDSDDDNRVPQNIVKKTTFYRNGNPVNQQSISSVQDSPPVTNTFGRFAYSATPSLKRSADAMAGSYGTPRRLKLPKTKSNPVKKSEPEKKMTLEDIHDFRIKEHVDRMQDIYPDSSIQQCVDALEKCRYNYDDALVRLGDSLAKEDESPQKPQPIDLSIDSDDNDPLQSTKSDVKRGVTKGKTIAERYNALAKPRPDAIPAVERPKTPPAPQLKKRRLIRPQPQLSPRRSPSPTEGPRRQIHQPIDISDDSDVQSEEPVLRATSSTETQLLEFLNSCTAADLLNLASQPRENIEHVLQARPFASLSAARRVQLEVTSKTKKGSTRIVTKDVGEKLVDSCLEMFEIMAVIDGLVAQCDKIGEPIRTEMKRFGFDVAKGEVELTEFDHDSGIGTPNSSVNSADVEDVRLKKGRLGQPAMMSPLIQLKDYQILGLNWLALLFSKRTSCILGDDMGLGKTCQVIGFLTHLIETGKAKGPHLIVVPGSTLENWLREFAMFSPKVEVRPYYGSQKERGDLQYEYRANRHNINVIVTTYDMTTSPFDNKFLRILQPVVCVFDEGHMLRNSQSKRYQQLMRIPAEFRLLLTGTPLQNNLQELISLLSFIMPNIFADHEEDLATLFKHKAKTSDDKAGHSALLSKDRTSRARSMIAPFILRRKKEQVQKHLPAKTRRIEYCDLSPNQQQLYKEEAAKAKSALAQGGALAAKQKSNVMMDLRKAAIHPLLFRRHYTDKTLQRIAKAFLKTTSDPNVQENLVYEDLSVMTDFELNRFCVQHKSMQSYLFKSDAYLDSGKVRKLIDILRQYISRGDRTLLFSQFTMVMDILEEVFQHERIAFSRLDGSTRMQERQDLIDQFAKDTSIPVFMLSTKAGGAGINLACANKVIIFDSSFNPQDDIQAENRAHRVGQTREVEVVRLVSRGTVEEQIQALGDTKLALDERVSGDAEGAAADEAAELAGMELVERMLQAQVEPKSEAGDLKDAYMEGLKQAGLQVEKS